MNTPNQLRRDTEACELAEDVVSQQGKVKGPQRSVRGPAKVLLLGGPSQPKMVVRGRLVSSFEFIMRYDNNPNCLYSVVKGQLCAESRRFV